jgi:DNA (cytosine-5)-methyltransferase 1
MGFPETFILPETKTPAYRQMGNSVCVPIIEELAKQVSSTLIASDIKTKVTEQVIESMAIPAQVTVPLVA